MPQRGVGSMQGSTIGLLPPKVFFHRRQSSTKGRLPLKIVFHQKSSSTEGRLPPKVVFLQRSSSINHNTLEFGRTCLYNTCTLPYICRISKMNTSYLCIELIHEFKRLQQGLVIARTPTQPQFSST